MDLLPLQRALRPSSAVLVESQVATVEVRDPRSFRADLLRLAEHFDCEAARLRAEARDAQQVAAECRRWAADLRSF